MILIYILVFGWFKSYLLPLIIMTPIPISLIGILPGHYLMGAYFTATSMIGFIAGAGFFIMLFDPIFQGLAVSLMFGEIAATVISRFAVPLLYY